MACSACAWVTDETGSYPVCLGGARCIKKVSQKTRYGLFFLIVLLSLGSCQRNTPLVTEEVSVYKNVTNGEDSVMMTTLVVFRSHEILINGHPWEGRWITPNKFKGTHWNIYKKTGILKIEYPDNYILYSF